MSARYHREICCSKCGEVFKTFGFKLGNCSCCSKPIRSHEVLFAVREVKDVRGKKDYS